MIPTRRPAHRPRPLPGERAHATCDRLDLGAADRARFLSVFTRVREAELDGEDTLPLWNSYHRDPLGSDIDVAAYLEAVASLRPHVRNPE
jgi:hypothetical protein